MPVHKSLHHIDRLVGTCSQIDRFLNLMERKSLIQDRQKFSSKLNLKHSSSFHQRIYRSEQGVTCSLFIYSGHREILTRKVINKRKQYRPSHPPPTLLSISFSTDQCCRYRLAKFRLTVQQESSSSATVYTYTEPDTAGQATYTVVPPPSDISFTVSQVRFDARSDGVGDDVLTLCEVLVYGGEFMELSLVEVNLVLIT